VSRGRSPKDGDALHWHAVSINDGLSGSTGTTSLVAGIVIGFIAAIPITAGAEGTQRMSGPQLPALS
jgi:hypothetical protein